MVPSLAGQDGLAGVSHQLRARGPCHGHCLCASQSLGNAERLGGIWPEGSALHSLGLGGSCKQGRSHQGWGWCHRGAGPWEEGMCYTGKNCRHQGLLESISQLQEGPWKGCFEGAQPLEMKEQGMCFAASHPMPAPCWQESRGIAGGKEKSLGLWIPPAPSHGVCPVLPLPGPLLFPGISVTSVPCTEPGLPVQGPPFPCAPGLLMRNLRHQLLLFLLGYPGLPAHSRYARVHGSAPLSP